MKILVIDDEPLVRRSLKRALQHHGHEVFEAEDGQNGLNAWREVGPDLVFLDVLMPRMSGPELLKVLGPVRRGHEKVILMSAFSGEYDLLKAKSLGADLFIPKPFADIFSVVQQSEELVCER